MKFKNNQYILLFFLLLAILPYCFLCFFTNPSSDDFSLSAQIKQYGFFEYIYYAYNFKNGRYISAALTYFNPIAFGRFFGYKIVSFVLLLLTFLSCLFFITQITSCKKKGYKTILSLVFLLLFLQNMPIISEGIYWYTGAVIYTLGIFIFLIYLSFFIKIFGSTGFYVGRDLIRH